MIDGNLIGVQNSWNQGSLATEAEHSMDVLHPQPRQGSDDRRPIRGADAVAAVLRDEGVRHVFGNPGTTELSMLAALDGP